MKATLTADNYIGELFQPIALSVTVSEGVAPYSYLFTVYPPESSEIASESSQVASHTITPTVTGVHRATCKITDSGANTITVACKPIVVSYAASRLEDIYLFLKRAAVNVYLPATHVGECLKPYVVVKPALSMRMDRISTFYDSYHLLIYVPRNEISKLERYAESIREIMKPLKQKIALRETFYKIAPYYDDSNKAYQTSLEYRIYRKIAS